MEQKRADALSGVEVDPEVRAIVMTGTGRAFSSGYDIGAVQAGWRPWSRPDG
jgi:2-(1,2-epoxy-1,2-dihydrophenyl)acetyl-CoA isomerase